MCTGVEIAMLVGAAASGYGAISSAQAAKKSLPGPSPTKAAPAEPKAPSIGSLMGDNASRAATSGPASTFLSGVGGVDPSTLNIGRNTLLGG